MVGSTKMFGYECFQATFSRCPRDQEEIVKLFHVAKSDTRSGPNSVSQWEHEPEVFRKYTLFNLFCSSFFVVVFKQKHHVWEK